MIAKWTQDDIFYDGSQLAPGWLKTRFGIDENDVIVSFAGGCDVSNEFMVDMADLEAGLSIRSDRMLHFIVKHCGDGLETITVKQRMLILMIIEILKNEFSIGDLSRSGDDIFWKDGKLSISVATASKDAGYIHAALNIVNTGTPVKTAAFSDLHIQARDLAELVISRYREEILSIRQAMAKVKRY